MTGDRGAGRILVVEDDATNRAILIRLLQSGGFAVESVENGREALTAFTAQPFDLVLMDRTMPVMDGLAATRALRDLPAGATVPIIGITGDTSADDIGTCEAAGMDFVVGKPIDFDDLLAVITDTLSGGGGRSAEELLPDRHLDDTDVDPTAMQKLMARFGAEGLVELIDAFHQTLDRGVAASSGDPVDFVRIAHGLKSASAQLGLGAFSRLCREIEQVGADPAAIAGFKAAVDDAKLAIALNRPDLV